MLRLGTLLFIVSMAWLAACQPLDSQDGWVRVRRSPHPTRMMMVRNYLLRHPGGSAYDQQAAMSSFAAGTIATGAYYGGNRNHKNRLVDEQPEEKPEDKPEETPEEEDEPEEEAEMDKEEEVKPKAPKVVPKAPKSPKIPKRRVMAEDDDEEEEESNSPRKGGRKNEGFPTYSNFFPIIFTRGSSGNRRRSSGDADGDEEGLNPGLTAIANSFSTGRGAIASSTATAFGGSAPATASNQYRKSSPSRYRRE